MTDTQLIKDKLDIVDFINEYVRLKPAGINHKGCCPFHHEKTPSFMVNRERQSWHCFGCAKGGDIFSFLQEMEGMEFVEALKMLAERAGVQLENKSSGVSSSQKNRIKEINTEAARFFHNFLLKMSASKPALDYLQNRKLKMQTIEEWQIGFIPEQWDLLTKYLLKKGFSIDDLVLSGMTIKRDGATMQQGYYDRFRGRIMFPLWDVHGTVVGFTGRVLVETEKSGGKYVNTPQTMVYDKSRVVFGLDKAKQEIKQKNLIVMVEGQMDVIACHQAGMKNVVATSGTALTEHQIKLLKRYSNNMNIAFDADAAGQAAAERGIDLAVAEGMDVRIIMIPDGAGKDPDECLKKNPEIWFESVEKAQTIMDWYFQKALNNKNLNDIKQKQAAAGELLQKISLIPYAVEQDHWLRELGGKINVEVSVLRENMKQIAENEKKKPALIEKETETVVKKPKITIDASDRLSILIERSFILILKFPKLKKELEKAADGVFSTSVYSGLYEGLKIQYNSNDIDLGLLRAYVAEENAENIVDLLLMKGDLEFSDFSAADAVKEIAQIVEQINLEWVKKRRKIIQTEIEKAEKEKDQERLKVLFEEFKKLIS